MSIFNFDDEWWLKESGQDESTAGDKVEKVKRQRKSSDVEENAKQGGNLKKKHKTDNREESAKNPVSKYQLPAPKKKKKRKKTLTEKVQETKNVPLKPANLIDLLLTHFDKKLASFEWEDVALAEQHFGACNDFSENTTGFLRLAVPKLNSQIKNMTPVKGAPLILIISSAAIRAVQLNRELIDFKGPNCKSAKLFAKHMKISEQVAYLSKYVIHLGIGTPSRIQTLIDDGSLKLDNLKHVILDWSWRDSKLRRMVDIPEVKDSLMILLRRSIIQKVKIGRTKLIMM